VIIESRSPLGEFGQAGRNELIKGRYEGTLNPRDPRNGLITDIALGPRNPHGLVDYSATFAIAMPIDPDKASGVLIYDVPNRGYGIAVGDPYGHVHVISGWQGDIPPNPSLQTASVPTARNRDGSVITGQVFIRVVDPPNGARSVKLSAGLGAGVPNSEPASLDNSSARLLKRRSDGEPGEWVPVTDWAFADCENVPFPGVPDGHRLCLKSGFDANFAYELTYIAKEPPILGIGFAAVRDFNAFLRYSPGSAAAPNPLAHHIRWAVMTGVSQAGNFVRSFIHLGFNEAEDGRQVFDGANPRIAARQVPLNIRFGVPGGAANRFEPGSEGALWWDWHDDSVRGRGRTSLLARCQKSHTCPKIVEMFGSAELWGLRMSPDLVGIDAKADIALPPNVYRYYFPGVTHGGGGGGFDLIAHPTLTACALGANPNPSEPTVRALMKRLLRWVTANELPPPSRYPTIAAGDLVLPTAAAMGFPVIPGEPLPDGKLNPLLVYDFGKRFRYDEESGVIDKVPPGIVREGVSLVPRVDADGNENSGVRSVQMRVPLGTYLGWNATSKGYYAGSGCGFSGGFIPFAATRAERLAANDPRPSLEERYGTHDNFVLKVRSAAYDMVAEGFLLPEDAERIVAQAQMSAVLAN
jgi:hypothetical protein